MDGAALHVWAVPADAQAPRQAQENARLGNSPELPSAGECAYAQPARVGQALRVAPPPEEAQVREAVR